MDFVRFQRVIHFDEKYKGKVSPTTLKMFD